MVENPIVGPKFRPFLYTVSCNRFNIPHKLGWLFGLVEWTESEGDPWYRRKWWEFSSFVISRWELPSVLGMSVVLLKTFSFPFGIMSKSPCFVFTNNFWHFFWQLATKIRTHIKTRSPILRRDVETHLISSTTPIKLALMRWNLHRHVSITIKSHGNKIIPRTSYPHRVLHSLRLNYEGRLTSSWTGGSAPLLCRQRRWFIPSCSGGGKVVVAWSSSL
jgi:hypothetical protein